MTARNEMAGILQHWLQLAQKEGEAIESGDWAAVIKIQARKTVLREKFTVAALQCAALDATDASGQASSRPFRLEVARIVSLLTRNGEALAEKMRQARERQHSLEQGRQNLGRIQRSYLRPQPGKALQRYS
jgi:hypothetical protein